MQNYLSEKLAAFMGDIDKGYCFPGTDVSGAQNNTANQSEFLIAEDPDTNIQKVIMVTIACSDRMREQGPIYEELKDYLIRVFEDIRANADDKEVIICLNIHTEGKRVQPS